MKTKPFMGLTLVGLASMLSLGAIATHLAMAQTSIDLNTLRSIALSEHNSYRTAHHSPNLSLNSSLNDAAQNWAQHLAADAKVEHSSPSQRNNAGENLFVYYTTGSAPAADTLAKEAVTNWYNEVSAYNYSNPGFASATGHFTQVVWKNSTELGCGAAEGMETLEGRKVNAFYVVCHYNPAGNITGNFPNNVLPP